MTQWFRTKGERRDHVSGYTLAIVATLLATSLRWAVDPLVGASSQHLFYYFTVVLVASFAGIRAGILAVLLGAVAGTGLFAYLGHVGADWTDEITRLVLFLIFGGVTMVPAGLLWEDRNLRILELSAR